MSRVNKTLALLFTLCLCSALYGEDVGAVLAVDCSAKAAGDGSLEKPFGTIKEALEHSREGTIIKVAKGVYAENLIVSVKGVRLIGGFAGGGDFTKSDPAVNSTVVTGKNTSSVFKVKNADNVRMEGFKIAGGLHGVEVAGGSGVTIANNAIDKNGVPAGKFGAGICLADTAKCSILNNEITNNAGADDGGGIGYVRGHAPTEVLIDGNHIAHNKVAGEHGVGIFMGGTGVVANCLIEDNDSSYGAGIFFNEGAMVARNNVIRHNSSHGIFIIDYSHKGDELRYDLDHNLIYGNKGGICSFWASAKITNCTVVDNMGFGYDRRDDPKQSVEVTNCIFWHNAVNAEKLKASYCIFDTANPGQGMLKADPQFASADPKAPDYHLKSKAGRWNPKANEGKGAFEKDDETSPAIGAAAPAAEGKNNGASEMGYYSNSPEASMSGSNNSQP